ncbi:lipoprotein [Spiroplasma eriocheiris]|uniref:Lipoprotein n=1 Tax=Spiroplasma eriocheiris TaxID=315358 RepID=A0A0H3XMN9_9MOLU|nr:lipoprotein [Spiroplasma eriocheiris]AHF57814.1 hypothetical protein SPE_0689 [Spiroplasma eriocheiris CCTCC M 207170]AKM54262.1 hypothetical protein SERIO_v1c06970 [Spiroplasma eriocheiris]
MKKLLAILGAVGLTATGASNIVACDNNKSEDKKDLPPDPNPTYNAKDYVTYAQGIIGVNFFDPNKDPSTPPLLTNTSFVVPTKIDYKPSPTMDEGIIKAFGKNFDVLQWIAAIQNEYEKLATALHVNKEHDSNLDKEVWNFDKIKIDSLNADNQYKFSHTGDITKLAWNISIKLTHKNTTDGKEYSTDFNSSGEMKFVDIFSNS